MDVQQWDALRQLGLTDNEVNTYLALLETGSTSVGPLVPKTQLHRSRLYASLERLVEKGFASVVLKGRKHQYQAIPPSALLELLDDRRKEIKSLVPILASLYSPGQLQAGMYEGIRGIKTIREQLLSETKPGHCLLVQGAPRMANERLERWFVDFHNRREKKGVGLKILYNADAREFGEKRKRLPRTQVRYMREKTITPAWIDLFPHALLIVVMPRQPVAFLIRDQGVRDSFASYFEILWKTASK